MLMLRPFAKDEGREGGGAEDRRGCLVAINAKER